MSERACNVRIIYRENKTPGGTTVLAPVGCEINGQRVPAVFDVAQKAVAGHPVQVLITLQPSSIETVCEPENQLARPKESGKLKTV